MSGLKRGSVAIVGAAESDLGQVVPDMSPVDLMAQATMRALDDCGLKLSDVDGVFAAASQLSMATVDICEYLGIQPKYQDSTRIGGSAFMSLLAHAHLALQQGLCNVAMITYGSTQRSVTHTRMSVKARVTCQQPHASHQTSASGFRTHAREVQNIAARRIFHDPIAEFE